MIKGACIIVAFATSVIHAREILVVAKPKIKFPTPFCITRNVRLPIRGTTDPHFHVFFYIDDVCVGETKSNHDGSFSYRLIDKQTLKHGVYTLTVKVVDPHDDMRVAQTIVTFAVLESSYYDSLYSQQLIRLKIMMMTYYGEE